MGHAQAPGHLLVVAMDGEEEGHQQGHGHHHQPGPLGELAVKQDARNNRRHNAAKAIEQGLALPARALFPPPMHHHARLREGEAREHSHRIQGDQVTDAATEDHQQDSSKGAQHHDAVAEHQPVAQGGQLAGHVAVLGQEGGQAREIGKGGIGS